MRFRAETIDADIPWLGHERDDVILFRWGAIFVMYELQGVRFETLEDILITERKLRLNHTYCQIAHDAITLTIWQHRGPANPSIYPDVPTDTPFAGALNLAYKAHLLDQTLYDNRIFLGIQVRPPAYKRRSMSFCDSIGPWHRPIRTSFVNWTTCFGYWRTSCVLTNRAALACGCRTEQRSARSPRPWFG